jgi:hypothetical protein
VLGEDGFALGAEEGAGDHLEHVVGAVAEHDLVDRHAVAAAQGVLQLEAVAVRVAGDVGQGALHGFAGLLADAEGFSLEASLTMEASSRPISRASSEIGLPGW